MYDYSAEMNGMIVFMVALYLIGSENISHWIVFFVFEQSVSISLIACMIVIKWLFTDIYDYSAEMNGMIVFMVALFLVGF